MNQENKLWRKVNGERILQCHTKGDIRFTPFNCYVSAFNIYLSIENHYQRSKLFDVSNITENRGDKYQPIDWKEAKKWKQLKYKQVGWKIGKYEFPIKENILSAHSYTIDDWGIQWYIMLWYKYLKMKPELIEIASEFDDFEDIFRGRFPFCQADVIRKVVQEGLESLRPMCSELWEILAK